jgi:hypothetical protein
VLLVIGYADQWQSGNGGVHFRFDASLISRVVVAVAIRFLFPPPLPLLISYGYFLGFP